MLLKKNNATSKIATVGGIDNSTNPVTFAVTTGEGSKFPASNFKLTIENEIMLVTSRTGDSLTATRAQESTSMAAHAQNTDVEARITAGTLEEYDNVFQDSAQTSVGDNMLLEDQASAPTTPSAGYSKAYFKSGALYVLDATGNELPVTAIRVIMNANSAFQLETSKPAKTDNNGTNKEDTTLDYDATTDETDSWEIHLPAGLSVVSASLKVTYRMASATSNAVVWAAIHGAIGSGEAWDAALVTDTFSADTVPDAAGKVKTVSKTLTTSGWAAGDTIHFKISRDADNGSDNATGDAKLMHAYLEVIIAS